MNCIIGGSHLRLTINPNHWGKQFSLFAWTRMGNSIGATLLSACACRRANPFLLIGVNQNVNLRNQVNLRIDDL